MEQKTTTTTTSQQPRPRNLVARLKGVRRSRWIRFGVFSIVFLLLTLWIGSAWTLVAYPLFFDIYLTQYIPWGGWRNIKNKYSYILKGIELMENDSDMTLSEIAHVCGVSEGHFRKLFREYSGENPIDFRQRHRIEKAKRLLVSDTVSVENIAMELHFSDIYHFSKTFKKIVGVSPKKYIKQN